MKLIKYTPASSLLNYLISHLTTEDYVLIPNADMREAWKSLADESLQVVGELSTIPLAANHVCLVSNNQALVKQALKRFSSDKITLCASARDGAIKDVKVFDSAVFLKRYDFKTGSFVVDELK